MKTPWLLCLLGLGDCTFPPYAASFVAPGHGELSHRKTDLPQRLGADDDASLLNYEGEPCNTPSPPFFFNDDGGGGDAQASALPPWSAEEFAFSSFANWLDRSSGLMVGRYPGVEPSRCTNATCAEEHLKQLHRGRDPVARRRVENSKALDRGSGVRKRPAARRAT